MLHRTEGIVLNSLPYGEADAIVSFFTSDYGVVRVFAKGPRKTKSRFGSALEPLTHSRMAFWGREHTTLPRLTQADIIYPHQKLREEFGCFLRVSEIVEMTLGLLPEMAPHRELFDIMLKALRLIETDRLAYRGYLFYKVKLLSLSGFLPRLSGCARCGRSGSSFYFQDGSIVCRSCLDGNEVGNSRVELSLGAISVYEKIRLWRWEMLGRLVPSQRLVQELERMLNLHIRFTIDKDIKTNSFIIAHQRR
ncbi:MAG: DNA repair protein RecO [Nitrospirae bacterium]|nr:DNA repair protein RecO [Nitrospirota bacterium]MBF0592358.1 DNA repair protein RecO [Nitrospirota bacterium]